MIRRIARVYRVEWAKATRRRFTAAGLLIVVAVILCLPLARFAPHSKPNPYEFIAYATPLALNLVGLLVLVVFSSNLFASELSGSLWLALVRPVRRTDLLFGKLALGMTYALCMTLAATITAWALAYGFGDLKGVTYGGETLFTQTDMAVCYAYGALLALLPQFAAVAYAVFVSVCVRSATSAIGFTIGIWLFVDVVKHPLHFAPYIFTSYVETPWEVFARRCDGINAAWWPANAYGIAVSIVWLFALTMFSAAVLTRRDFHT